MKTFKVSNPNDADLSLLGGLLKQAVCDHYQGLPVMRGLAFAEDTEHRFWGETSEGMYCARILANLPEYRVLESLKEEFLKLRNAFPEGVDFFVFFAASGIFNPQEKFLEESLQVMFSCFKSVRFVAYHFLAAPDGGHRLSIEEFFCIEKKPEPIENPLPDLEMPFDGAAGYYSEQEALPGPAHLTRQEIEDFFDIGLEIRKIRG